MWAGHAHVWAHAAAWLGAFRIPFLLPSASTGLVRELTSCVWAMQGCESDPEKGFRFLQSAAGSVVQDLDRVISGQIQLSEQEFKEQAAKVSRDVSRIASHHGIWRGARIHLCGVMTCPRQCVLT